MPKTLQIGQEIKKKSTESKKIPIFSQIFEFEGLSYTIMFKTEKKCFYPFWGSDMPNKLKNIIKNAIDYINVAKKSILVLLLSSKSSTVHLGSQKRKKNQFFEKFSFFPKNVPKRG